MVYDCLRVDPLYMISNAKRKVTLSFPTYKNVKPHQTAILSQDSESM